MCLYANHVYLVTLPRSSDRLEMKGSPGRSTSIHMEGGLIMGSVSSAWKLT
jgi:hypothetical protein